MNKRDKAIQSLCPTTLKVLRVFANHNCHLLTAHQVASLSGVPLGTVTPRLAELDERGYGFIREMPPVPGPTRKQKAWQYRGAGAQLFNVDRNGRVKRKLDYYDLWLRERTARKRLVAAHEQESI